MGVRVVSALQDRVGQEVRTQVVTMQPGDEIIVSCFLGENAEIEYKLEINKSQPVEKKMEHLFNGR